MNSRALRAHVIPATPLQAVIAATTHNTVTPSAALYAGIPATLHNSVIPSVARNLLFSLF